MTKETVSKIERLAKRCIDLDNMISSVVNNPVVAMHFKQIKADVLKEMELLITQSKESEIEEELNS